MNQQIENQEKRQNVFYPKSDRMRYMYIFLALIGLFTVLWYFLFKEEAIGKKIIDNVTDKLGNVGRSVITALTPTSATSPTLV